MEFYNELRALHNKALEGRGVRKACTAYRRKLPVALFFLRPHLTLISHYSLHRLGKKEREKTTVVSEEELANSLTLCYAKTLHHEEGIKKGWVGYELADGTPYLVTREEVEEMIAKAEEMSSSHLSSNVAGVQENEIVAKKEIFRRLNVLSWRLNYSFVGDELTKLKEEVSAAIERVTSSCHGDLR